MYQMNLIKPLQDEENMHLFKEKRIYSWIETYFLTMVMSKVV